jgi:holo-[acyl-carrier protein] synthase
LKIGWHLARLDEVPSIESPVYTAQERDYCRRRPDPRPSLAARFAAKKAAAGALGLDSRCDLAEIEVVRERGRAPTARLMGNALEAAGRLGLTRPHVSLTHSGSYAVAMVVFE